MCTLTYESKEVRVQRLESDVRFRRRALPESLCRDCKRGIGDIKRYRNKGVPETESAQCFGNLWHLDKGWPYIADVKYWQCRCRGLVNRWGRIRYYEHDNQHDSVDDPYLG